MDQTSQKRGISLVPHLRITVVPRSKNPTWSPEQRCDKPNHFLRVSWKGQSLILPILKKHGHSFTRGMILNSEGSDRLLFGRTKSELISCGSRVNWNQLAWNPHIFSVQGIAASHHRTANCVASFFRVSAWRCIFHQVQLGGFIGFTSSCSHYGGGCAPRVSFMVWICVNNTWYTWRLVRV